MLYYLLKRLLLVIPTIVGVAVVIFILMRMLPGDIVEVRLAGEGGFVTQQNIDMERARLGLDKPMWRQFADWMWGMVRLDFGNSMWTG
ncbi:MAG: ABC transporter permease, partial [Geminicoccales bacterium]